MASEPYLFKSMSVYKLADASSENGYISCLILCKDRDALRLNNHLIEGACSYYGSHVMLVAM